MAAHENCGVREPGPQQLTQVPRASSLKQQVAEQSPRGSQPTFPWPLLCVADTPKAVCSHKRGWEGVQMEMTLDYKCCSLFSSFRAKAGTPFPHRLPSPPGVEAQGQGGSPLPGPLTSALLLHHLLSTWQTHSTGTARQHASCVKQEERPNQQWGAERIETVLQSSLCCFSCQVMGPT